MELGSGDYPMRCCIGCVHRINRGGIWGVVDVVADVQGDGAVAAMCGLQIERILAWMGVSLSACRPIKFVADTRLIDISVKVRLVDGQVEDIGAVAVEVGSTSRIIGLYDVGRFCVALASNRPNVFVAFGHRLDLIELFVEFEVESIFEITATIGVGEYDFVVGVLVVGLTILVPIEGRSFVVGVANILILDGWHLVLTN